MFSRIDELFGEIAGELASTPIFEEVDDARNVDYAQGYPVVTGPVMTGAKSARMPTPEELEALIRDGKSLDGYDLDDSERRKDSSPEEWTSHLSSVSQ